jgi:hypothetical protein
MRFLTIIFGTFWTIALMTAALWGWQNAGRLTIEWSRPDVAVYGVRCAAVAVAALAQVILVAFVVRRAYRPAVVDAVAGLAAVAVLVVAAVSAVALTLVGS